jgi:vacuolar-type H+-ATPase subunit F/Vma7
MSPEDSLPAWWMDKISIASNNLNKSRDYLLTSGEVSEGQLKEAISGSDRKILFILVREIVRNLKSKIKNFDVNNKSHLNRVGSSILGIIRAMTYSPDNVNYKNFKKYFPKNFNSKLIQKKLKQFHSQNDKVQVTLVTQAIKNELSEGVKEGKLNEAKETIFDVAKRVMKDKQAHGYKTKKGLVKVDMQTANLLMQVFKKVNPKMKKILSDLGYKSPTQLMNTLWAVAK